MSTDHPVPSVRPATGDDSSAVADLIESMGGHDGETLRPGWTATFAATLYDADSRLLVAESGRAVVGVANVQSRPNLANGRREAWLAALVVAAGWRSRGIGELLLDATEHHASTLGCEVVVLESSEWRHDAHRFYRRHGYSDHTPANRFVRPVQSPGDTLEDRFVSLAARAASDARGVLGARSDVMGAECDPFGADGAPTKGADRAVERTAWSALAGLGVPVVSEEAGLLGDTPVRDGEPWVCLDPLDGTRNYLHGYPPWALSAGLVLDGVPLAGFVADLSTGKRWWGIPGSGAWVDGRDAVPCAGGLLVAPGVEPGGSCPVTPAGYERTRMSGATTIDLCRVADGSAGAFLDATRAVTHPHDLAGPLAILLAAGCTVTDLATGARPVIASDPAVRYRLVAAATADAAATLVLEFCAA